MTYAEAFDWIMLNVETLPDDDFTSWLNAVRSSFPPEAQGLIDTLVGGVEIKDMRDGIEKQLTLEQFFEELRPQR